MSDVNEKYVIGIDVGTGSARAALLSTTNGQVLRTHVVNIQTWNPQPDHYEQSSDNIWSAVCQCVRKVIENHKAESIVGIGFDGTCSLVVLDAADRPVTVSTTGVAEQNVILWMDHRAARQTDRINATKHPLLRYVGGLVSVEMQCPKLLWIKENLNSSWCKANKFFDLPDFLTYRCTGTDSRSLCSVVCKWNYDAAASGWSADFFAQIGLSDLIGNGSDFGRIGKNIQQPGQPISGGLSEKAAKEFGGLLAGTAVGTSMIDAHAGATSLFGCNSGADDTTTPDAKPDVTSKMALICGTSSCHMSVTRTPIWANGIWGPYFGAIFPQMYLHEGGQSATGILLDHVVRTHPAYDVVRRNADKSTQHPFEYLNCMLDEMAKRRGLVNVQELTRHVHVWPDFHGNRSPLADAALRGMITGLSMSTEEDDLAIVYLATVQALAYGTRHILDTLNAQQRSPPITTLLICGGLSKNRTFVQAHAEACDMPVLFPYEPEMVLVGAGILGACAAGQYASLEAASAAMAGRAEVIRPRAGCTEYHRQKYRVFLKMLNDQQEYRKIMQ